MSNDHILLFINIDDKRIINRYYDYKINKRKDKYFRDGFILDPYELELKVNNKKVKLTKINNIKCISMGIKIIENIDNLYIYVVDWETINLPPGLHIPHQGRLILLRGNKDRLHKLNYNKVKNLVKLI